MEIITNGSYKIRPAGRHILTIGRDLIQDRFAAIVELVKNAYDADSSVVSISFVNRSDGGGYSIAIADHGHGMSRDTVINSWMVPSTSYKVTNRTSPNGRVMQGSKGVGRYATAILGDDLLLETTTATGENTTAFIEWVQFQSAEYLDDVEILVETKASSASHGTTLTITGKEPGQEIWGPGDFSKLRFELKKLIPPIRKIPSDGMVDDAATFRILLSVTGFGGSVDTEGDEILEPFPIFDLFDYRISGRITDVGTGDLIFSQQNARNTVDDHISFDLGGPTDCGALIYDIRVYDRDKDAIDALIGRGLKDERGEYVGKMEARRLLNEYNGIGVYRNGFRLRPLGDPGFDWLTLNDQRIQNPSLKVGSNQVIGFVLIQSEETSGLIEKSARDGLRDNRAFAQLKNITQQVLGELEQRRFAYRQKAGLSRTVLKVERELERLFTYEDLKRGIRNYLSKRGIDSTTVDKVDEMIAKDEVAKSQIVENIRIAIAVYQGQATLGKIVNVILHEGRRPLNYIKNQNRYFVYWLDSYMRTRDLNHLNRLKPLAAGIERAAEDFAQLFNRLDPLAAARRSAKTPLPLRSIIEQACLVFGGHLTEDHVELRVDGPDDFLYLCWRQDIYGIFTNLVDNSLFWMREKHSAKRSISIVVDAPNKVLQCIDYRDSGPGIEPGLIESQIIFEPNFSTKPSGTGLGLAIAGEAAHRNGLELIALESDTGAYFRLQPSQAVKL